jgi:hypothetical protein
MAKDRSPTDYLSDDWGLRKGGDPESDLNIPMREDMPPEPQRGYDKDGSAVGGYGHSEEVKFDPAASKWGMDNAEIVAGYSKPGSGGAREPGTASYPQSIPQSNEWDRTHPYSKEHHETGAYDGKGNDNPHPGTEQIGSRENPQG